MSDVKHKPFPFDQFERQWQDLWDKNKTYKTLGPGEEGFDDSKPKYYVLDMFPYPSGAGLHVGHPEGYTATDIIARYKRMNGHNVLHPMGWDAFGLPAEQYAIKTGQHPRVTTEANTENFRQQLKALGFSYDWDREINTTDPEYIRWTQWIFIQLYNSYYCSQTNKARPVTELVEQGLSQSEIDEQRLAYIHEAPVNWSPDLGTVLANEEVEEWKAKGHTVERRPLKQWMLRITKYAQRLIDDLETLDWPESVKSLQTHWIGRSEGAEVDFTLGSETIRVYTTRPDTLYGATYLVLAPEHPLVAKITTKNQCDAVQKYQNACATKSDQDRQQSKEKTGVFTGAYATHPVTGENVPVWIADYVMMGYGTGAIMAVPAHDERDYEFAKTFELPIIQVVQKGSKDVSQSIDQKESDGVPLSIKHSSEKIQKTQNLLPDWQQNETAYFVTWRTADSLPQEKLDTLQAERADFHKKHNGEEWSEETKEAYHELFSDRVDTWLDEGAGKCVLKKPELSSKVLSALHHFDGERYHLHSAVVMPNHVHIMFSPIAGNQIQDILHSWKSFTAKEINKVLGETGEFWQRDYYDRFIRSEKHFLKVADYIRKKPIKAHLPSGAFSFYEQSFLSDGRTPSLSCSEKELPYSGHGIAMNSDILNGLPTTEAKAKIIDWLEEHNKGTRQINFKLRDWLFSRQRYWGEPFPILWDKETGEHTHIPEEELPLLQPEMEDFKPTGDPRGPLVKADEWIQYSDQFSRETNTMPQWAGSCWYYMRYCDPKNRERFLAQNAESYWSGKNAMVDLYIGGTEHAVLHLLYARFWHKVLYDLGLLSTTEPFQKLVNQGLILGSDGQKMSKSLGNVVNPDDVIAEYGADSLRLYEMFMGPLEQVKPWQTNGVDGVSRFLAKIWRLAFEQNQAGEWEKKSTLSSASTTNKSLQKALHQTIKKVSEDIETLSFNTAISQMMVCLKEFQETEKCDGLPIPEFITFLKLLNPFAPHLTEELNKQLGSDSQLCLSSWPKYDESFLVESEITMVVQVNGKVRAKLQVDKSLSKEDIESLALNDESVKKFTQDLTIRKVIVVPSKLVNIVVS